MVACEIILPKRKLFCSGFYLKGKRRPVEISTRSRYVIHEHLTLPVYSPAATPGIKLSNKILQAACYRLLLYGAKDILEDGLSCRALPAIIFSKNVLEQN